MVAVAHSTKKVLVVEDEPSLSKVLVQTLKDSGYSTLVATDGQKALTAVQNEHPDIVLLDVVMPVMNGFDFLQHLRVKLDNKVPVIILSNLEMHEDRETGKNLGAQDYIVKSNVSLRALVDKVHKTLNES